MGLGFSVWAMDFGFGETVFVTPTSTTYSLAPSYLLSTSYATPTAYVVPNYVSTSYAVPSYLSTSYVVPSSYYATTYTTEPLSLLPTTYVATAYRRGLFGRRWLVERPVIASYGTAYFPSSYATTYVPSSYVYPSYVATSYRVRSYTPTVYEYPAWETASVIRRGDCDEVALAPSVSSPAPSSSSRPSTSGGTNTGQYDSIDDPTIPSTVEPLRADERAGARTSGSEALTKGQAPSGGRADTPPIPPAAEQGQQGTPKNQTSVPPPKSNAGAAGNTATPKQDADAATKSKAAVPTAPAGDSNEIDLRPAPGLDGSGTIRRDSGKAIYSTRALRPERRNILVGRVESSAGEPQGEVPVTVTSRSNRLIHRDGLTNAFGGFAIRLADGEWTVNVTMPSGRVYPVRTVTVSNGKVVDNAEGREVHNLIITY
jgi:hypothetical protein